MHFVKPIQSTEAGATERYVATKPFLRVPDMFVTGKVAAFFEQMKLRELY